MAVPELLIYAMPVLVGVIAGKYLGRIANFSLMLAVFQLDLALLDFLSNGTFHARLLIPIIFVWPPLSLGQFVPPLVFLLAAMIVYRLRYALPAQP
jgi:hypothetical protein